jgi:hypothetical protein
MYCFITKQEKQRKKLCQNQVKFEEYLNEEGYWYVYMAWDFGWIPFVGCGVSDSGHYDAFTSTDNPEIGDRKFFRQGTWYAYVVAEGGKVMRVSVFQGSVRGVIKFVAQCENTTSITYTSIMHCQIRIRRNRMIVNITLARTQNVPLSYLSRPAIR